MTLDSGQTGTLHRRHGGILEILLGSTILASVIPYTHALPFLQSYLPVMILYVLLLSAALALGGQELAFPPYVLICIGILWLIFTVHLVTGPVTVPLFVRVPVFVVFSVVNLVYLPRVIPLPRFAAVTGIVVAVIVSLGLLNFLIGDYFLWIFEVEQWRWSFSPIPAVPIEVYPVKSVFHNVNPFSQFALVGTFTAMIAYLKYRHLMFGVLVVVNGTGLYFSNSRGAIFAAVIGVSIFLLYLYGRSWHLSVGVFAIIGGVVGLVLMLLGVIPSLGPLSDISLSGRSYLWRGAIRAALKHPVIGYGPGDTSLFIAPFVEGGYAGTVPHNTYLRIMVTTGFAGLSAYVAFFLITIRSLANVSKELIDGLFLGLFVCLCVHQLFENYSIFGLSSTSVTMSLVSGYALQRVQALQLEVNASPKGLDTLLCRNEELRSESNE